MKKYYTPEIELEIISTSDICTLSTLTLSDNTDNVTEISWNDTTGLWK